MLDEQPYPTIVAVDFDGVIASCLKGWQEVDVCGELIPGARDCLMILKSAEFIINIFTTRLDTPAFREWFGERGVPFDGINSLRWNPPHTGSKPIYSYILDDRAIPGGRHFDEALWKEATAQILDKEDAWLKADVTEEREEYLRLG